MFLILAVVVAICTVVHSSATVNLNLPTVHLSPSTPQEVPETIIKSDKKSPLIHPTVVSVLDTGGRSFVRNVKYLVPYNMIDSMFKNPPSLHDKYGCKEWMINRVEDSVNSAKYHAMKDATRELLRKVRDKDDKFNSYIATGLSDGYWNRENGPYAMSKAVVTGAVREYTLDKFHQAWRRHNLPVAGGMKARVSKKKQQIKAIEAPKFVPSVSDAAVYGTGTGGKDNEEKDKTSTTSPAVRVVTRVFRMIVS